MFIIEKRLVLNKSFFVKGCTNSNPFRFLNYMFEPLQFLQFVPKVQRNCFTINYYLTKSTSKRIVKSEERKSKIDKPLSRFVDFGGA